MTNADNFTNVEMPTDTIPSAEGLAFEALEVRYRTLMWLSSFGVAALVIIINSTIAYFNEGAFGRIVNDGLLPLFATAIFLGLTVCTIAPHLLWRTRGFRLRTQDIHYKHGILWRSVTSLPFTRIQHVELESGPLERFCKLSTLKFYSAGGGSADMKIPGLSFAVASKIRSTVMSHVNENSLDNTDTQHD